MLKGLSGPTMYFIPSITDKEINPLQFSSINPYVSVGFPFSGCIRECFQSLPASRYLTCILESVRTCMH